MQHCSKIVCKNTAVPNPQWQTSEGTWVFVMHIAHITFKGFCFTSALLCQQSDKYVLFVCPSAGDMPPCLSKWKRIPGGSCLRAPGESSPAANGSRPPLGTVRCYFYDSVRNVCHAICSTVARRPLSCLTLVNLKVITAHAGD